MTTPFPLNNSTQIAEKSILDLNGKQTYLGNSFSIITSISLTDTVETPKVLIINPATSGKAMFIYRRSIFSASDLTVSYYVTPTVTSSSTVVTPVKLRPAYATTSVVTANSTLSIAANGTLTSLINSNNAPSSVLLVIDPGLTLLVTVQAAVASGGSPATGSVETCWYEV